MIAGRRDRKRSLIRSSAMTAAMARSLSTIDGVAAYQSGAAYNISYARSTSPATITSSQPELTSYLRQLSTLHAAGILNDEEFSAARERLLGS
jgi:hypothetical protein